jgi:O-antigen ligase
VNTALCFGLAALLPGLLAFNLPPSATVFNQAAAWAAWGLVAACGPQLEARTATAAARASAPLAWALSLLALVAWLSGVLGPLPAALAWSAAATLAAAASLALLGAALPCTHRLLVAWFSAWLAVGLVNALIGTLQVFAPEWADGQWIARSHAAGRAIGNVRQPNHLAGLLLWGAAAVPALLALGGQGLRRGHRIAAAGAFVFIVFAVMLTGSRTGVVGILGLAVWGLLDRRLVRFARALLISAPFIFMVAWALTGLVPSNTEIGVAQRIGQVDVSSGRVKVWLDTLGLIAAQPWRGVGFGQFNLAWTLTPVADRAREFFDHSHNLPLQLLAELGLPMGLFVLGLLAWALWRAVRNASDATDERLAAGRRGLLAMLLLSALHSLFEYPLWYAHFLFPAAVVWGLLLGASAETASARARWSPALGVGLVMSAAVMLWDYRRVSVIFEPDDGGASLVERIATGQRSWFFAHHADYARITALEQVLPAATGEFARAAYYLLDTRLLTAWANAYAREGDLDRARWIAARLRELQQPAAESYFAACDDPALAIKPYQCAPPTRAFSWRDFR